MSLASGTTQESDNQASTDAPITGLRRNSQNCGDKRKKIEAYGMSVSFSYLGPYRAGDLSATNPRPSFWSTTSWI